MNLLDPFSPQEGTAPAQNSDIGKQWSDALNDPAVRTSLLQFGISMLQPPSWGDTFGSQFGRAVGSSGEALTRSREEERRQAESEAKNTLRESQATAAEARAGAASARAGAAGAGLELQKEKLQATKDRMSLTDQLRRQQLMLNARKSYDAYAAKYDADILTQNKPPKLSFDEYVATIPELRGAAVGGGGGAVNIDEHVAKARAAIANGADPDQVRAVFRTQTGQEAPF